MYLLFVNPFWALEKIMSRASFSLLFKARDSTLNIQLNKDIGRQFVILELSPSLGMSRIRPVLKVCVRHPFYRHQFEYLKSGMRK